MAIASKRRHLGYRDHPRRDDGPPLVGEGLEDGAVEEDVELLRVRRLAVERLLRVRRRPAARVDRAARGDRLAALRRLRVRLRDPEGQQQRVGGAHAQRPRAARSSAAAQARIAGGPSPLLVK